MGQASQERNSKSWPLTSKESALSPPPVLLKSSASERNEQSEACDHASSSSYLDIRGYQTQAQAQKRPPPNASHRNGSHRIALVRCLT